MNELSTDERAELIALRARILELERERTEQIAAANVALAKAQERSYWLDRWHLDLNALMARRGAAELRAFVRLARYPARALRRVKRALRG